LGTNPAKTAVQQNLRRRLALAEELPLDDRPTDPMLDFEKPA